MGEKRVRNAVAFTSETQEAPTNFRSGGGVRRCLLPDTGLDHELAVVSLCHQVNFMLHTYYRPLLTIKESNRFKMLSCVHFLTVAFH